MRAPPTPSPVRERPPLATVRLSDGAEIGPPRPTEHAALVRLLDACLRPEGPCSVADDLPLLVGAGARSVRLVVRCGDVLASHAALAVMPYRMLDHELVLGIVGAVATAPEFRRRGYASEVVGRLVAALPALSVDVCVLWTDQEPFYGRLGFVRAGRELLHAVGGPAPAGPGDVRPAVSGDRAAVAALHALELSAPVRTPAAWDACLSLPGTRTFVLDGPHGPAAYGVVGKGADLQGCLHEWGGPEDRLPALVDGVRAHVGADPLYVMSAPWKVHAAAALESRGATGSVGALGMLHVPDPAGLAARLGLVHLDDDVVSDHARFVPSLLGAPHEDPGAALPFYVFGLDST